jgi:predicted nucleic acid-binding protein
LRIYLDSSAILKRYIREKGTERVQQFYLTALNGEGTLHLSTWNIGEILGAMGKYYRREWLGEGEYRTAHESFINEMTRLIKLGVAILIPVKSSLLAESWPIVDKHSIYQVDALQITSAKSVRADHLLTGDQRLAEASNHEDLNAIYLG